MFELHFIFCLIHVFIITILSILKINCPFSYFNLNASLTKIITTINFVNYISIVNDEKFSIYFIILQDVKKNRG